MRVVGWELDNLDVLLDLGSEGRGWRAWVESAVTALVMGASWFIARAVGMKAVNEDWTPRELKQNWERKKNTR